MYIYIHIYTYIYICICICICIYVYIYTHPFIILYQIHQFSLMFDIFWANELVSCRFTLSNAPGSVWSSSGSQSCVASVLQKKLLIKLQKTFLQLLSNIPNLTNSYPQKTGLFGYWNPQLLGAPFSDLNAFKLPQSGKHRSILEGL